MRSWALTPIAGFALATSLTLLSVAQPAAAQVRVAVVPFAGAGGSGARRQVQSALQGDSRVSTVDLDRVDAAAERVGASSSGEGGIAELAQELEARVVVQGTVSGRGRRRRLTLVARDAHGSQVGRTTTNMRGGGVARAVRAILDEVIDGLPPPPEEPDEAPPEPVLGEQDAEDGSEGEEEEASEQTSDLSGRAPLLNVQLALGIRTRDATISLGDGTDRQWNARPVYAELGARAELRPLASDPGLLRGLYGDFFFANSVGLSSSRGADCTPTATDDCKIDTNFFRVSFAIGILFPIVDLLDLGVEFGAGWDVYNIEANPVLPSAEYVYLRPAVRGRLRLARELAGIDLEIGLRPVVSRGDIGFGQGGDTFGLDVGGGLSGSIPVGGSFAITYGVQLAWVGYWLGYAPSASGGATDATSGSEQGVRVLLGAGLGIY